MGRWLLLFVLALGVGRLVVPTDVLDACVQDCADDDDCGDCTHVSVLAPAPPPPPVMVPRVCEVTVIADPLPASADIRKLLDVPKPLVA